MSELDEFWVVLTPDETSTIESLCVEVSPETIYGVIHNAPLTFYTTKDEAIEEAKRLIARWRPFMFPPMCVAKAKWEHSYLVRTLRLSKGNVTRAAKHAKKDRSEFHRLLKKHKLYPDDYRMQ